ncbi:facilitated trehalose transporter Tret1-like [Penaeus japonicus]|uniref:facilitated trehalose transporter Tret1-like n=1 Tax=Penaeus japonicus TaxID=27405 RepID=UPI001C70DD05|nr:facilitated trehalose transporter Tret1-like [Penaeus japonicus]
MSTKNLLDTKTPSHTRQYLATLAACTGALSMGATLGFSSPAGPLMMSNSTSDDLTVTPSQFNWVSSSPLLGGVAGGLVAGVGVDFVGRRGGILISSPVFFVGCLMIALARDVAMLLVGRLACGMAMGAVTIVVPTFTGEIASPDIRGLLGSVFQVMVTSGILSTYVLGGVLTSWRSLAGIMAVLPVLTFISVCFLKESPVYLVSKGKEDEAATSLQFYRGKHYDVTAELQVLKDTLEESRQRKTSAKDILKSYNLKPFLISLGIFLFAQFSGITAILSYMSSVFQESGSNLSDDVSSSITAAVMVAMTVIASGLVDKVGRKALLVTSAASMAIAFNVLAQYFAGKENNSLWVEHVAWIPLACLVVFISAFSVGFGPIPWLLLGELFSPEVKDVAVSLVQVVNWSTAFLTTLIFAPLQTSLGNAAMYLLFSGLCVLALAFSAFLVPETKGKTLQEIAAHFGGSPEAGSSQERRIGG